MSKLTDNNKPGRKATGGGPAQEGCCGSGCASCPNKDGDRECGGDACASCEGCGGDGCRESSRGGGPCGCAPDSCSMRGKLHSFNYFEDIPGGYADDNMVEVQFKNTRKGFYLNSQHIPLEIGDWVAVEAQPGHDIGRVSLTGALVRLQMRKAGIKPDAEQKRVFRKAKPSDMERYEAARAREQETMIRSRKIAESLQLNMKIGDVEYQGDGNKAIFYYIADERVDFRQLIKVLAETFKIRIEMKQIGARQEAGRIGGIGPCGRPLCCTTWMSNFASVSTSAARFQDISLNPQKLAGQCAKLKCCLNFEIDTYLEASKKLPAKETRLETADSTYFYFKADIFKREITYSTDKNIPANLVTVSAERAFKVIEMNKNGEKPLKLAAEENAEAKSTGFIDIVGQDSLTRFDNAKKKKKKNSGAKGGDKACNRPEKAAQKGGADAKKPADRKPQRQEGNTPKGQGGKGDAKQSQRPDKGQPRPGRDGARTQPGGAAAKGAGEPRKKQPRRDGGQPQGRQSQDKAPQPKEAPAPRLRPLKDSRNEP